MTKFEGATSFRDCEAKGEALLLAVCLLVLGHQDTRCGFKGHGPVTFNPLAGCTGSDNDKCHGWDCACFSSQAQTATKTTLQTRLVTITSYLTGNVIAV